MNVNEETLFDPEAMRKDFAALQSGLAFFDAPGGTQVPRQVADAVYQTTVGPLSNRSPASVPGRNAEKAVTEFRAAVADLTGANPEGVVHGRSATNLIMDFARGLAKNWVAGDNVVLSQLDHDANVAPWLIAAQNAGAEVRFASFDPETAELDLAQYEELIDDRTRLVAVTGASNFVGTKPDVARISKIAHAHGAYVCVDAVHLTAHVPVDVASMGADFTVLSPYKLFGPHLGVLVADPALLETITPDKLRPSPNQVPERFELGTLPYEQLAGVTAMVNYIASFGAHPASDRRSKVVSSMNAFDQHELALRQKIEAGAAEVPGLRLLSKAADRTSTLLFTHDTLSPQHIEARLAERGVVVQAGHFYAQEACEVLGLGETGGLRIGLAPYNNASDIERLLEGLSEL